MSRNNKLKLSVRETLSLSVYAYRQVEKILETISVNRRHYTHDKNKRKPSYDTP
jgi:hypothetical protein